MEGVVGAWRVVPREVFVHVANVPSHLLLALLWDGSQDLLQVLHLCPCYDREHTLYIAPQASRANVFGYSGTSE